ncbi:MAG: pullulanase-type alpha-1,6-glucosidase [Oligoflexus sp.]
MQWMQKLIPGFMAISLLISLQACQDSGGKKKEPEVLSVDVHLRLPVSGDFQLTTAHPDVDLESLDADAFGQVYRLSLLQKEVELELTTAGAIVQSYRITPDQSQVWLFAASPEVYLTPPPIIPQSADELVIYYQAPSSEGFGLHVWDAVGGRAWTSWEQALNWDGQEATYGEYVSIKLPPQSAYSAAPGPYEKMPERLGLIVHRGEEKATDGDVIARPQNDGNLLFLSQGSGQVYCTPDLKPCDISPKLTGAAAHWVSRNELLWQAEGAASYFLLASPEGNLMQQNLQEAINKLERFELQANSSISGEALKNFPHLRKFRSFTLQDEHDISQLLKSELIAVAVNDKGGIIYATRVQLGGVLDDVFAFAGDLGLVLEPKPQLRLWAPTAQSVELRIYDGEKKLLQSPAMKEENGVWQADLDEQWVNRRYFYRYAMQVFHPISGHIERYEVTDPYSVSLSTNSQYSQMVDLNAADLKPEAWDDLSRTPIKPTDMSIYEVHVRDFSIADSSLAENWRGTYMAFTANNEKNTSVGVQYLQGLREAGLTHIQVLPVYDFATVNEDPQQTLNLDDPFRLLCEGFEPAKDECKKYGDFTIGEAFQLIPKDDETISLLNKRLADQDSYNWGYDPFHYGVPEGSYATDAEGEQRILEFRSMVKALKDMGYRFAMDVVYNHTYASGLFSNSVLDRVVPGYYHRLNPFSGAVETSTCCANTASERVMMEKLMIDTLKRWVDDYQVDAFRFDLMAHHMKANMLKVKEILGPDIYIYGEGWDFGEVGQNQRGVNASQLNLTGAGIGSFNDRLRDAVRGGGAFDCGYLLYQQGLLNGLAFDDNGRGGMLRPAGGSADCANRDDYVEVSDEEKRTTALYFQDRVRLGLLGSLQSVEFTSSNGRIISGQELDYYGAPAAYTASPEETINYVQNHDNQTYWDINQIKLPFDLTMEERVRVHNLGVSVTMLSTGVPYFEMGMEILRSKSLHRDAYNSGDWLNQVDFSLMTHNWDRGLPMEREEGANVKVLDEVITALPEGPETEHMQRSLDHFRELLQIRKSSPLFRLATAADVKNKLSFLPGSETELGLIAMHIVDGPCQDVDLDENLAEALLIFNLRAEAVSIAWPDELNLHPVQQASSDPLLAQARYVEGSLQVPARTMAIFTGLQPTDATCVR